MMSLRAQRQQATLSKPADDLKQLLVGIQYETDKGFSNAVVRFLHT